jgi:hypothetical protein
MTSPRLIFNDFFRNPFGGEMKSIGGMGGGDGVLENIQQQVADNGEALQALQGGIGGLPSGNLPTGGIGGASFEPATTLPPVPFTTVGDTAEVAKVGKQQEGMPVGNLGFTDDQLRADYDKAVEDARRQRAEGFMGRMVLPGEMSFEDFKQNQMAVANSGAPLQTQIDLFNIAQPVATVEQNPGIGLIQDPGISNITGNLYNDTSTGSPQLLNSTLIPTGVINQDRLPSGSLRGNNPIPQPIYERPGPDIGMEQLFGRAFAGRPI